MCLVEVEIAFSEILPCSLSHLLQRYKWLSVRLCSAPKIFRSRKGYTAMFYHTFVSNCVASLFSLFISSSAVCHYLYDTSFVSPLPGCLVTNCDVRSWISKENWIQHWMQDPVYSYESCSWEHGAKMAWLSGAKVPISGPLKRAQFNFPLSSASNLPLSA